MLKTRIVPLDFVRLAQSKLICANKINISVYSLHPDQKTAILNVWLRLDYESCQEPVFKLEALLVASYMCIAYSIPKERVYFRSSYPSEPILAEAAAHQMYHKDASGCDTVAAAVDAIRYLKQDGYINKGKQGKLVAQMLLMFAHDAAIRNKHVVDDQSPLNYSKGVPLTSFIKALFHPNMVEAVLNLTPNHFLIGNLKLCDAFEGAIV